MYTRDTPDFLVLSFEAQGLLELIMRKLDRAGVLHLGKQGKRGVAIAIGHPHRWQTIAPALDELLDDGCLVITGAALVMPNFLEAQTAVQSDRMRQQVHRERRRDVARAQEAGLPVTPRDVESHDVTESHVRSRAVTNGHSDLYLAYPEEPLSSLRSERGEPSAPPPAEHQPPAGNPPPVVAQDKATPQPALPLGPDPSEPSSANGGAPRPKRKPRAVANTDWARAIDAFDQLFRAWAGKPPRWGDRERGQMKQLLEAGATVEEIGQRACIMFDMAGRYPAEHPDMGTLLANWDKFVKPQENITRGSARPSTSEELGPTGERPF